MFQPRAGLAIDRETKKTAEFAGMVDCFQSQGLSHLLQPGRSRVLTKNLENHM